MPKSEKPIRTAAARYHLLCVMPSSPSVSHGRRLELPLPGVRTETRVERELKLGELGPVGNLEAYVADALIAGRDLHTASDARSDRIRDVRVVLLTLGIDEYRSIPIGFEVFRRADPSQSDHLLVRTAEDCYISADDGFG